jgi:hypothetical protein
MFPFCEFIFVSLHSDWIKWREYLQKVLCENFGNYILIQSSI